MAKLKFLCG